MTSASGQILRPFNCLSVQGTGGSPTGPVPENRVCEQDIGGSDRPVSSGCKYPVRRGIVVHGQDLLRDLRAVFFFQNILQLNQQRWVILRINSLTLWKIIKADAFLIPENRDENFSSGFLHPELFGAL